MDHHRLFTIEYIFRIISINRPWKYVSSFYGIIDLLAILPMYLSIFFLGLVL
jgi:voltage-gated potassium channel